MGLRRTLRRWLRRPHRFRVEDFEERERLRDDYRLLAAELDAVLDFGCVLDLGCGNAFLVEALLDRGKTVRGIEVSPAVEAVLSERLRAVVQVGDFTVARGLWDLVACVEVAEHLPPARSQELVETLVRSARRWIYFTAAPVGQAGRGHINCRPLAEWSGWFLERGWEEARRETVELRRRLRRLERARWLGGNSLVLRPAR